VASKAVAEQDQVAAESQVANTQIAQQRIGDLGLLADHFHGHDHEHEHHHEEHDPGFWKKKVIWKEGWKKTWVSLQSVTDKIMLYNKFEFDLQKAGKKQIWKPDWKKIWKPVWVPIS
jgi:hypothetical protein